MLSSLIKNSSDKDILDKNKTRYIFDINNDIHNLTLCYNIFKLFDLICIILIQINKL